MGIGRVVLAVVAACAVGRTYLLAAALPERVATHFDAAGRPNGWMPKDVFLTVHVAMFGLLLAVFLGMPALLRRVPVRLVSLPNKDYWLAPGRREASVERFGEWFAWLGVATGLVLALAQELALGANLHGGGHMEPAPLIAGLVAYAVFVVAWIAALYAAFRIPEHPR